MRPAIITNFTKTTVAPPPFSPTDISGMTAWYDVSQLSYNDNDAVSSFTDLSGGGFHATTNGYFSAPIYKTNQLNGLPVLRFTASSNQALRSFPTSPLGNTTWTCFVVARLLGTANGRVLGSIYPTKQNWLLGFWNGNQNTAYYEGFVNSSTGASTLWQQYTGKGTGSSGGVIYSRGTLIGTGGGTASPNGGLAFSGYSPTSSEEFSDCEIAEVILYNVALNDTDREAIETYLIAKYAL